MFVRRTDERAGSRCEIPLLPRSWWIDTRDPNGATFTICANTIDYVVWVVEGTKSATCSAFRKLVYVSRGAPFGSVVASTRTIR